MQAEPPKKKSDGFGAGLFDFDTMKAEQAKIAEKKQTVEHERQTTNTGSNLLHTGANDTLDSLWSPP